MRTLHVGLAFLVCLLAGAAAPRADVAQPVTAGADVGVLAKLALVPSSIAFADADPDTTPFIPASSPIAITAKARTTAGAQVQLTVQATDDLRSGLDTIPADALRWTATGSGFVDGTLSRTAAQTVGAWTNSGIRSGTQHFTLANSWERVPGSYSVTLVYTLSAQ